MTEEEVKAAIADLDETNNNLKDSMEKLDRVALVLEESNEVLGKVANIMIAQQVMLASAILNLATEGTLTEGHIAALTDLLKRGKEALTIKSESTP